MDYLVDLSQAAVSLTNLLLRSIGYHDGERRELSSMELRNASESDAEECPYRYGLFLVSGEDEALTNLRKAYQVFGSNHPAPEGFDKRGYLIKRAATGIRRWGIFDTDGKTIDKTIRLTGSGSRSLLEIKLFNRRMCPIPENIILQAHLWLHSRMYVSAEQPAIQQ